MSAPRLAALAALTLTISPLLGQATPLHQQTLVILRKGDITIATPARTFRITADGRSRSVVKSPDAKLIAFIHQDVDSAGEGDPGETSLRVADVATGQVRQVFAPKRSDEPKLDMRSFDNPRWSLEGGYIYVDADAWVTSAAVHQIKLTTGEDRFVIDGSLLGVIRQGPYRGYLLVRRHRYRQGGGSYDPVYLVRPDGTIIFQIDGSDSDSGEHTVPAWLNTHGWSAS